MTDHEGSERRYEGPSSPTTLDNSKEMPDGCPICGDLKQNTHHREVKVDELIASACGGCTTCELLRHGLSLVTDLQLSTRIRIMYMYNKAVVVHCLREDGCTAGSYEFYRSSSGGAIMGGWAAACRDLPCSLEERLRLAKSWLDRCLETHIQCPAIIDDLPKRVLLLGDNDNDIRLLKKTDERGGYVALSYCWGTVGNIETTRQNLAGRLERIPPETVPQTILDAIHITRYLGFKYLWVDSLCIIQRDSTDWNEQSSVMGDIYAKAAVVIAAHSSGDAHGGCLWTDHMRNEALATFSTILDGKSAMVSVRKPGANYGHSPAHCTDGAGVTSKLESRGWTLQEWLLARRILHCTSSELAWECSDMLGLVCECSTESMLPEKVLFLEGFKPLLRPSSNPHYQYSQEDLNVIHLRELLHDDWRHFVDIYSSRNLTFAEDRLIAIAGIASAISQASPVIFPSEDYLFGLWRESLTCDLIWYIRPGETPSRRLSHNIAPSWSWASLGDGDVKFATRIITYDIEDGGPWPMVLSECEVLRTFCSHATQNVFGTGTGCIEIRGRLQQIDLDVDFCQQIVLNDDMSDPIHRPGYPEVKGKRIVFDVPTDANPSRTYYMVEIASEWRIVPSEWRRAPEVDYHGLLLVESQVQNGAFERVGYFKKSISSTLGSRPVKGEERCIELV